MGTSLTVVRTCGLIPRLLATLLVTAFITGCDSDSTALLNELKQAGSESLSNRGLPVSTGSTTSIPAGQPVSISGAVPPRTNQTILVASFNIQVFGKTKATNPDVMRRLASIMRLFDVVAIQEIRSVDDLVMPTLVDYVNETGVRYAFDIGPRLGRSNSKEQYAFLYDSSRITLTGKPYTVTDGPSTGQTNGLAPDLLHREPLVASFRTLANAPFSFSLVNIHTDPDEAKDEVNVLHDVLLSVRHYEYATRNEDDVMLLGDLNAGPNQLGKLGQIPGTVPIIVGQSTMVEGSKTNDNILLDTTTTVEFTGRAGVLSMADAFRISSKEALQLSDHNPVWAEFRASEQTTTPQLANQSAATPVR
jgi:deoxyribonuclease-1-like protein